MLTHTLVLIHTIVPTLSFGILGCFGSSVFELHVYVGGVPDDMEGVAGLEGDGAIFNSLPKAFSLFFI